MLTVIPAPTNGATEPPAVAEPKEPRPKHGLSKRDDDLAALLDRPYPKGLADRIRYDHSRSRWHYWDGQRWAPDQTRKTYDLLRDRVLYWLKADSSKAKIDAIVPLLDESKKESVLKAFSSFPSVAMTGEEWDTHPYLLGFSNGVLDLRDLSFAPDPDPSLLITRSTRHRWNPDAQCPRFMQFVSEIMSGDPAMVNYLNRVLGYSMWGFQREQKFWMFVGQGQNGKGTLAKVVTHVLGDYADTPAATLYMRSKWGDSASKEARPDLLRLQGVRFTWMSEPRGGQFNEDMLKAHTGDDPIQARDLYGKASSFSTWRPTHTVVFLTNDPPRTEDVGVSMARRARVIQFREDFSGPRENRLLEEQLKEEAEGILVLMAAYASLWAVDGLQEPDLVADWSQQYIEDNDPLAPFIIEACNTGPGYRSSAIVLYAAYQDWTARKGIDPMSLVSFGILMSKKYHKRKAATGNQYQHIAPKGAMDIATSDDDDD